MKKDRFAHFSVLIFILAAACASPWIPLSPGEKVLTFLDVPIERLHAETDRYVGSVFEGRFKFYRIYHDKNTADLSKREQVIAGKTHFTARPLSQYIHVIQIQITPRQEKVIRKMGIGRQDVIRARVRFAGIAPGGALAFDLMEILK